MVRREPDRFHCFAIADKIIVQHCIFSGRQRASTCINVHHRHSNLLGNPPSTEVLQRISGGIAPGNSFGGAIPGADDDTPD